VGKQFSVVGFHGSECSAWYFDDESLPVIDHPIGSAVAHVFVERFAIAEFPFDPDDRSLRMGFGLSDFKVPDQFPSVFQSVEQPENANERYEQQR
jgi:hypothetical protein